jgi:microcystin degradation protein MlrC
MRAVFREMKRMERDPRVLSVSLFMVHPYTTAADLGWAVHICTDDEAALGEALAEQLADRVWALRNVEPPAMRSVEQGLDEVAHRRWPRLGPVSMVDCDDIVGAGAPGGNTQIAAALAGNGRGLRAYVPIHDPRLVDELWHVELGARRQVTLRGTPGYDQPEVTLHAIVAVKATTDFGRTLRLDIGDFHIAICEGSPLPIHPKFWRELGLSPRAADVIVQKNFFHYRIFYAAISLSHIGVVSDGATSLDRVRTRNYRVPTHPATQLDDWRPYEELLRVGAPPARNRARRSILAEHGLP